MYPELNELNAEEVLEHEMDELQMSKENEWFPYKNKMVSNNCCH
jgi:hypothetical protein